MARVFRNPILFGLYPDLSIWRVVAREQDYSFCYSQDAVTWQPLTELVDGRILNTPVAGGFVGAYLGMYARSNGHSSENVADFDWFEYLGLDDQSLAGSTHSWGIGCK